MDNEIKFERVSCNLCGSNEGDIFLEREDLYTFIPGKFTLVHCRKCGLVYLNPRPAPESFELIYPPTYGPYTPGLEDDKIVRRLDRKYGLSKRVNLILRYKKRGVLCDLGCATGDFLEQMAKKPGWQVLGVEPNTQASAYARSLGLNVLTATIDQANLSENIFDVITMWNVIEHLTDPTAILNVIFRLLKPGGILVISTPNQSSFDARLFGRYWSGFELPRHFFVFSTQTLEKLLVHTGYNLIENRYFYGSHASFMSSLRFRLRALNGARPTAIENIFFSLPIRIVMGPFFFVLDRLKLSSSVTMICQKSPENR